MLYEPDKNSHSHSPLKRQKVNPPKVAAVTPATLPAVTPARLPSAPKSERIIKFGHRIRFREKWRGLGYTDDQINNLHWLDYDKIDYYHANMIQSKAKVDDWMAKNDLMEKQGLDVTRNSPAKDHLTDLKGLTDTIDA